MAAMQNFCSTPFARPLAGGVAARGSVAVAGSTVTKTTTITG